MERTGKAALYVRVPAVVEAELAYLDLAQFRDRWVALCFMPHLEPPEATFLGGHAEKFAREHVSLLAIAPDSALFDRQWISRFGNQRLPLLADPLRRLRRRFDVPRNPIGCQTFVIGPDGLTRCRIAHDLTDWSLRTILELLRASRTQGLQRATIGSRRTVAREVAQEDSVRID